MDNPTGQSLRVRKFLEVTNPTTGEQVFSALDSRGALSLSGSSSTSGSVEPFLSSSRECSLHASRHRTSIKLSDDSDFDGRPVNVPHPLPSALDVRRAQAFTVSTVFIYDFLVRSHADLCASRKFFESGIQEESSAARFSTGKSRVYYRFLRVGFLYFARTCRERTDTRMTAMVGSVQEPNIPPRLLTYTRGYRTVHWD